MFKQTKIFVVMKHFALFLLALNAFSPLQAEVVQQVRILGGSQSDVAKHIIPASAGGFLLVGYTESTDGDISVQHHGGRDAWVVRLNDSGDILWQLLLGGSGDDEATGVVEMAADGWIVGGHTCSADGDFSLHQGSVETADLFIVKISDQGDLLWTQTLGTGYDDRANDVVRVGTNRIVLGATVQGQSSDLEVIQGLKDMWLAELDGNGNVLWERAYGGSLHDELHHLGVGTDGSIWLAGCSDSFSGLAGDREGVVMRVDSDGELLWTVSLGSEADHDDAVMSSFLVEENGDTRIGFSTTGSDDGLNCTPHGSVMIAHLNADGEWVDTSCFGGSAWEYARTVVPDGNGHYWILGDTRSTDGDVNAGSSSATTVNKGWLLRCDNSGSLSVNYLLGGPGAEYAVGLAAGNSSQVLAVLNTLDQESPQAGDSSVVSDVLLVSVSEGPASVQEQLAESGLLVFPNPASDQVIVEITDSESDDDREEVIIRDITGRVIFRELSRASRMVIPVNDWRAGVYFLTRSGSAQAVRLVVE